MFVQLFSDKSFSRINSMYFLWFGNSTSDMSGTGKSGFRVSFTSTMTQLCMDLQKIHRSQILKSVLAYAFDFVRIHQEQLQRGQTVEYLSGQTGNFIHVQNPEKEMENIRLLLRL